MGVLNAVETIIGTIKFKRGLKENLPTLKYGEPAYAYDENELYIGGKDGDEIVNKKITRNSEVAANTEAINNLTESVADNTASLNDNTQNINGLKSVVKYGENETTKILTPLNGVSIKNKDGSEFMSVFCSDILLKSEDRAIRGIGSDQIQIKCSGELRLLTDNPAGVIISNTAGIAYVPIVASAFNVGSKEEFKTNIEEINADLDLLKNSKIYEYNLKNELEQGIEEKHYGFVIDRETPKEILSPNGDTIDIYSLVSLLWRQNQELLERITILENSVMELGNLINKEEVK